MQSIKSRIAIKEEILEKSGQKIKNTLSFKEVIEANLTQETTVLTEIMLLGPVLLGASDMHFEPEREVTKIRLRIDGILHDIVEIGRKTYSQLLSRLKLLSGVKINITEKPQNGRFTIVLPDNIIEVRAATLPSEYGESLVLRILDPKNLIEIEQLGVREDLLEVFKKQIQQPNGLIVATGPTGSGKTTTLYAILKRIQRPEIKIITIEDPIEYHLEGISQTQVQPEKGYDFPTGLKAIVRQDPDVILVGEIRDFETAKISLQAALTGHLVLATLHTNDATGTIVRLQALGEKVSNIAPALNMSIGQRLVRKVCKKCVAFSKPTPQELQLLKKNLAKLPKKIKLPKLTKNIKIPRARGCAECNFTGYKGRTGLFEFFLVDPEMEAFILKSPSISQLRKEAERKGMINMKKDGLIKVVRGETTFEEVSRVTKN
jgi:type II secretory ATPase GspE/PulE/Tfp pilus assembly ATPase PilB-like protein